MNVANILAVILLSAGTSVGVNLLMASEPLPADKPELAEAAEQDGSSVRQLRADVARLHGALNQLRARVAEGLEKGCEDRATAQAEPSEDESATAMTQGSEPPPRHERLDAAFDAEPHDPTWPESRDLPARLKPVVPQGSSIVDIECRATFCRVETQHPDPEHYQAFVGAFVPTPERLGQPPLWPGVAEFVTLSSSGEHGSVRAVAYLAREDHALP